MTVQLAQAPPAACPVIVSMTETMHQGGCTDATTAPRAEDFLLAEREEGCWRGYQISSGRSLPPHDFLAWEQSILRIKIHTIAFRKKV